MEEFLTGGLQLGLWSWPLIFLIGMLASFANSIAAGGSAVTLPVLILLGLSPTDANGTNRFAILMGNFGSVSRLQRGGFFRRDLFFRFALPIVPGAVGGALLGVHVSDDLFRVVLAFTLVWVVIAGQISGRRAGVLPDAEAGLNWKNFLAFFAIGFYGGFIQVGVGFWLIIVLSWATRLDILRVNALKGALAMVFIGASTLIFALGGKVIWSVAVIQGAGALAGGWMGGRFQIRKGEKWVRRGISFFSLLMAAKLIWDFL